MVNLLFLISYFLSGGQPTGSVTLTVITDQTEAPVRLAYVLLVGEDELRRVGMTDMEGRLTFAELPDGRYTIGAGKAPHVSVTAAVTIAGGARTESVLRLLPGAVVTGVLVNEDGTPSSGRDVTARLNGQPDTMTVTTNSAGEYRLFGLVAGTWTITVPRQTVTTDVTVGTGESVRARTMALPATTQTPPPTLPGRSPVQSGNSTIIGILRDADSGTPLPNVAVSLNSNQRTAKTDANGRFEFRELAAATYSLAVREPGYGPAMNAEVPLAAGATVSDVELRAGRYGSLAGVVRDAAGDPAAGIGVRSLQIRSNDTLLGIMPRGSMLTDDRGQFRIGSLPPSEYLICACPLRQHPVDPRLLRMLNLSTADFDALAAASTTLQVSPPTFFPGSTRMSDSIRLHVPFGDDRLGMDITMPHVQAFTVSGRITANGAPPSPMPQLLLVPDGDSGMGMGLVEIAAAPSTKADGTFLIPGVPAGRYTAFTIRDSRTGTTAGTPDLFLAAAIPVDVTQGDVTGLDVALRSGATIRGRIQFSGSGPEPTEAELAKARISLQPAEITLEILSRIGMAGGIGQGVTVNQDRTFELGDVPRGRYFVSATIPGTGWKAERVLSADMVEADVVLTVAHNGIIDTVVTLGDTVRGTLLATVDLGKYEPPGTVRVVLFPVDASTWDHPLRSRLAFQTAMLRIDGTFSITDVPEGEYYVARESSLTADLGMSALRLRQLAPTAQRVTIRNGQTTTVVVRR